MRVVIDACIDPWLVEAFPDRQVQTLFDFYRPLFPQLVQAVETIRPGGVVHVYGPHRD